MSINFTQRPHETSSSKLFSNVLISCKNIMYKMKLHELRIKYKLRQTWQNLNIDHKQISILHFNRSQRNSQQKKQQNSYKLKIALVVLFRSRLLSCRISYNLQQQWKWQSSEQASSLAHKFHSAIIHWSYQQTLLCRHQLVFRCRAE